MKLLSVSLALLFSASLHAGFVDELELLFCLDRLPEYRTDTRVEQISSYDRTGMNDDGFSGKNSFSGTGDSGCADSRLLRRKFGKDLMDRNQCIRREIGIKQKTE